MEMGIPVFVFLSYARSLHIIGSPLLSLLFVLDYTRFCFCRSIFVSLHGTYYKSENRQTPQHKSQQNCAPPSGFSYNHDEDYPKPKP